MKNPGHGPDIPRQYPARRKAALSGQVGLAGERAGETELGADVSRPMMKTFTQAVGIYI